MQTPVQSRQVDCVKQFHGSETGSPGKENSATSEENNLNRNMTSFIGSPTLDRDRLLRQSPTSKDEFWDSLRLDYDYLMDDGLIATCREASSDLSYDDEENATIDIWSFTKFIQQFNLLHDMLHHLQSTVAESGNSDEISMGVMEERAKVSYLCKLFNEQAIKLSKKYPNMRDEIHRRLNLLNNKWEAVEQSINPHKPQPTKDGLDEISNQMICLRRWLRKLEDRLYLIKPSASWTSANLEEKLKEQQILQKEIESKGRHVSSLLKLCECLKGNVIFSRPSLRTCTFGAEHVRNVARNLEHRWHSIFLRSLEHQCLIEELIRECNHEANDSRLDRSFSDEPLKKYPRLSGNWDDSTTPENEQSFRMNFDINNCDNVFAEVAGVETLDRWCQNKKREVGTSCEIERGNPCTNDKGIMVGSTGISQLKAECGENTEHFEIVQDVGYSSETSAHFSNDEPHECPGHNLTSSVLNQPLCHTKGGAGALHEVDNSSHTTGTPNTKANAHSVVNTLSPDKYPAFNLKGWQLLSNEDLLSRLRPKTFSTTPNSFYKMTSIDSDAYEDVAETTVEKDFESKTGQNFEIETSHCDKAKLNAFTKIPLSSGNLVAVEVSTSKSPLKNMLNPDINSPCNKYSSPNEVSRLANASVKLGKRSQKVSQKPIKETLKYTENTKRSARVREWLNTCQTGEDIISTTSAEHKDQGKLESSKKLFIDSSCDASGEYTTTESDCDKSAASDDINNSLSFTRSFTGSVETVVPISIKEANDDFAGTTDPSANVCLRKKRQNRERPWSAIEAHQMLHSPSHFSHSTSEGAINTLPCTPQSSRNTFSGSKKFCLESAKSLLPFISYSSGDKHRRRSHSRSSFRSTRHCSETGSDGCLTFKRRLCFSTSKPSSLDNSQHSASTTFEQSPSAFTSASDGTNEVLHSSSSAHQLSYKSSISESSKRSTRSHCKRNSKAVIQEVSRKEHSGSDEIAPEKGSVNTSFFQASVSTTSCDKTTVNGEDQSSVSDQVWDEYQDPPYLSEPYSEQTADEDQVRKLINFGDDYGTLLGSHSDASSIIAQSRFQRLPNKKPRKKPCVLSFGGSESRTDPFDSCSDSDTEDFLSMLSTSNHALISVSGVYNYLQSDLAKQSPAFSSKFANIVSTCQMNLCLLNDIQKELNVNQDVTHFTVEDFSKLQEVIKKWEVLQAKLLNLPQKDNETQTSTENLEAEVLGVCDVMATLKEKLNYIGNNALKALDSFSELKVLDSKIMKLQAGLTILQEIKDAVLSVNARIVRLAAESGRANISPLKDNAARLYRQWEDVYELNGAQLTKLQALRSRWKDPEEKDIPKEVETVVQWHQVQAGDTMPKTVVSEESRLPKAGAEVLIPDHHDTVVEMNVIPLPSASEKCKITNGDEHSILELPLLHLHPPALKFQATGHKRCCSHSDVMDSNNESSSLPRSKKTRSRLWRTIRAAVPIQIALVMLYCMACLLEPHCCDNLNNFNFSVWPQLRYVHGPPPV